MTLFFLPAISSTGSGSSSSSGISSGNEVFENSWNLVSGFFKLSCKGEHLILWGSCGYSLWWSSTLILTLFTCFSHNLLTSHQSWLWWYIDIGKVYIFKLAVSHVVGVLWNGGRLHMKSQPGILCGKVILFLNNLLIAHDHCV